MVENLSEKLVKGLFSLRTLFILFALFQVSGGTFASAAPACQACHTEKSHPLVTRSTAVGCISCHAGDAAGKKRTGQFFKVSSVGHSAGTIAQSKVDGEFFPGMHLPMRYEVSRIGKQPNQMALIPAGEFTMGSDERLPDEGPAHQVTLGDYWLDRYEVTNLQYRQFIDATGRKSPRHYENRTYPDGLADHPVVYVSWYDAKEYCEWAGKRLPTAQEWEKGARGSDARIYPWGDKFDITRANMPQRWKTIKQDGSTSPVGAFKGGISPFGLYDMSGNVWEWTSSWYQAYPGNNKPTENYGETYKTLKGGSWWSCSFYKCGASAPAFNRSFFLRTTRNKSFGFRCAKDSVEGR